MDYESYEDIWRTLTDRLNHEALAHAVQWPRQPCSYCSSLFSVRTALEDWFYGPYKH